MLVQLYVKLWQEYEQCKHHCVSKLKQLYHLVRVSESSKGGLSLSLLSSLSSDKSSSSSGDNMEDEGTMTDDSWADILGSDWRGRGILGSDTSLGSKLGFTGGSDVPKLVSIGHHGSNSSTSSGYSGNMESEFESEMLEVLDDPDNKKEFGRFASPGNHWEHLRRWVHQHIEEMYANHYEMPCGEISRGPSHMHHVLFALKSACPNQFCEELCITPLTFHALVAKLASDIIFGNNLSNPQMPVEEQLAIMLYWFGHDGNSASLQGVAN